MKMRDRFRAPFWYGLGTFFDQHVRPTKVKNVDFALVFVTFGALQLARALGGEPWTGFGGTLGSGPPLPVL